MLTAGELLVTLRPRSTSISFPIEVSLDADSPRPHIRRPAYLEADIAVHHRPQTTA